MNSFIIFYKVMSYRHYGVEKRIVLDGINVNDAISRLERLFSGEKVKVIEAYRKVY